MCKQGEFKNKRIRLSERLDRIEKILERLDADIPKKSCICFGTIPTMTCPIHGLRAY